MTRVSCDCDVLVVGGGNAALCAAIAARRAGASVLLLEAATKALRGGNARHSRNMRVMHDAPTPWIRGRYPADDYRSDLRRVAGAADDGLTALFVDASADIVDWLAGNGVRFHSGTDEVLPHSRKTAFFLGGGKALVNALYDTAGRLGVIIRYDSTVRALHLRDGAPAVTVGEPNLTIRTRALVVASGGFQANPGWMRQQWGGGADGFTIRGTPHATGIPLKALLGDGAEPVGAANRCHMVAVDGRAPQFDGGIVTRLDGIVQGIVVDRVGRRFADEGAVVGSKRYTAWGELVARCPGAIAFSIFDAVIGERFRPSIFPAIRADGVGELASVLGIASPALEATVTAFNAAITGGDATAGIHPPKTQLAVPIAVPPFGAYPVRVGVTSTCLGVRIDGRARVLRRDGSAFDGVYAAGVVMAPNILGSGYLAGSAMAIGAVFGRIAGLEAAAHALH
ncbi:tricarballylate dehydrogenase [Azospirillum lipoferum]|uniref:FAD-dependent tricarballylate dehydrogenase TcuA n=1 Tax=Azospirillum lipoferum TaxID=193 RepID=A0A5A9G490_AZOLI|nr:MULTISPECIES: FAD-dependent tricarballylate dehydrogenase TcuA [Azospirillum]KAA0589146.1 FAD-dependent tricarballylate dehydrogenase TcuA [Azospirillum lipoferum]MCP1613407.1 tricarballylate dehydrogenase [Azospirillum lipoferum]MDW5533157.1 FAD-dependent tricarballylate dehydrogenase TcuA [Azospirillum sp. NL1]